MWGVSFLLCNHIYLFVSALVIHKTKGKCYWFFFLLRRWPVKKKAVITAQRTQLLFFFFASNQCLTHSLFFSFLLLLRWVLSVALHSTEMRYDKKKKRRKRVKVWALEALLQTPFVTFSFALLSSSFLEGEDTKKENNNNNNKGRKHFRCFNAVIYLFSTYYYYYYLFFFFLLAPTGGLIR